jgi:hypothetical protein
MVIKTMKNKDFTNAARNVVINEQHITKLKEHLEKAEKEFQAKARDQAPTQTFLSRTYSL